jgi:lysophospholipase-2
MAIFSFSTILSFLYFYCLASIFDGSYPNHKNNTFRIVVSAMSTPKAAASSSYRGALIFMHGLGDSPMGWSNLEQTLPRLKPNLSNANIKYVFPAAPTIPITINGGMSMPGWFDLFDWPIGVGSKDDPVGLMKGVEQIEAEVAKLETEHGIPSDKIIIGGFSQGGAVALLSCYHQNKKLESGKAFAGCVGLSAWLTLPKEVTKIGLANKEDPRKSIPLFWGHGTYDDKVLFEQQKFGIETLTNGFGLDYSKITQTQYPMGHQSCQQETQDLADFVDSVLFGSDGETKADL